MSTTNCPTLGPKDSLSRDDLISPAATHGRLAFNIAIGAFIGLLLALAGMGFTEVPESIDRLEPGTASPAPAQRALDGHGKWGGYTR
ncbi:MAG: hypothetical protein ACFB13_01960 [Kiloniellaceae bacterium]